MWSEKRSRAAARRLRRWDERTAGSPPRPTLRLQLLLVLASLSGTLGEIDVAIKIPVAVVENSTVKMTCDYNLHSYPLYSVKWYKGQNEFYRYIPKEMPSKSAFAPLDVKVDLNLSDDHNVIMNNVDSSLAGKYRCEVSTDSPSFITKIEWGYMHIVRLPEGNLTVRTEKPRYSLGDTVRGNCTAPPGRPPANITWTVNGRPINSSSVRNTSTGNLNDNRRIATAGLELELGADSFVNGRLRITCRANVFHLYNESASVEVEEERPRLASISMPGGTLPSNRSQSLASNAKSWFFALAVVNVLLANVR